MTVSVLLSAGLVACGGGATTQTAQVAEAPTPTPGVTRGTIGRPLLSGDLSITASAAECARATPTTRARASTGPVVQTCTVPVSITNLGQSSVTLMPADQKAIDTTSGEYAVTPHKAAGEDLFAAIEPGATRTGEFATELTGGTSLSMLVMRAPGATPVTFELPCSTCYAK